MAGGPPRAAVVGDGGAGLVVHIPPELCIRTVRRPVHALLPVVVPTGLKLRPHLPHCDSGRRHDRDGPHARRLRHRMHATHHPHRCPRHWLPPGQRFVWLHDRPSSRCACPSGLGSSRPGSNGLPAESFYASYPLGESGEIDARIRSEVPKRRCIVRLCRALRIKEIPQVIFAALDMDLRGETAVPRVEGHPLCVDVYRPRRFRAFARFWDGVLHRRFARRLSRPFAFLWSTWKPSRRPITMMCMYTVRVPIRVLAYHMRRFRTAVQVYCESLA
jgi:hypothetical protein